MRTFLGLILILFFLAIFSYLFIETTKEFSSLQSINDVLDKNVEMKNTILSENSYILDQNGNVISDLYPGENRIYLSLDEIPQAVIDALLSVEDQRFYEHPGFDLQGISRALFINISSDSLQQGGSTITQQLVRNLYLTHNQTYERKLTEILYAYQLERSLSKEKILELYTNAIYFQNGVYGIEAASRYYFNKPAKNLTVAEAAFLCAIPNHPEKYNPLTRIDNTNNRKEWILQKMLENGKINDVTFQSAMEEPIELALTKKIDLYPDYVTYIFSELEMLVSVQDGYYTRMKSANTGEEVDKLQKQLKEKVQSLLTSGITIETALDPETQTEVVHAINQKLEFTNLQGAAVIIDHDSNEVIAITGGVNYKKADFHRGYQAYRQPGSSIKPLLVFAPYMEETNTNEHALIDASPFTKDGYSPRNYGGAVYGMTNLEHAFKHSYNTASVRMMDRMTPSIAFSYLNKLEFARIVPEDEILPAALGGLTNGVSVLEMTKAYTTFSNGGQYNSPKGIRQVVDKNGNVLYKWPKGENRLWSEETNREVRKMMSRVTTEGTGRHAHFSTTGYLGGKTGTTNAIHDLWFIGVTDQYTAGIWLGMDTPQPITSANNERLHLTIWRTFMSNILGKN
ncbi:transglycosylase domain-containing protein [Evansella tamaricis]|uniref:peptidoglycan glycosyltransferase n=1 Tax=Evansella tamaricis TaxID=2069301 RepID=A0ABS6JHM6_9BACI|nr:transglycosylase domain-containing protein [Evansella tamaricis]MBU9713177.1 penicillin-binding protein [Evansella tamaricis]